MANLTLRLVKGSPLTNAEVDANFSNLNTAKYEAGDSPDFVDTLTDKLSLDLAAAATPTQGEFAWSVDDRTALLGLNGLALPIGQEELLFVRNNTASPIAKGTAVMATGTIGASGRITAAPMDGTNVANAKFLIGIAAETIAADTDGFVANFGKIREFDTSAFAEGSVLWVSTTTAGALTATAPTSGLKLPVAFVVTSHASVGAIFVRMTTGSKFSEAHDATFTSLANGDVLIYNSGVWENKTQANLFPSQTGNNGRFLTTNGTATSWANVPAPNNGNLTLTVAGTGLSGSASFSADQAGNSTFTVSSNATSANTVGAIVARDGSGNFSAGTITAALSGNATTATTLQTARTIGGVSFNGSANINLPGVNTAGNQNTTGNAATATTLQTARTINGVSFNGSANITITAASPSTLTRGTGLTGNNYNGSAATTWAVAYGTTAGTACQGNDSRLSNARQATNTNTQLASLGVGTAASGTTGEIRATGNVTAFFSDDRLKTKQGGIDDALAKVRTLSGFYYVPNEVAQSLGYEAKRDVGVSAQQVQAVQPEAVAPAPIDEQYLTVRYERLVPLLIEAIKQLDGEVQSLKAQLKG